MSNFNLNIDNKTGLYKIRRKSCTYNRKFKRKLFGRFRKKLVFKVTSNCLSVLSRV